MSEMYYCLFPSKSLERTGKSMFISHCQGELLISSMSYQPAPLFKAQGKFIKDGNVLTLIALIND
jgi:hypothetical protein